MWLSWGLSLSEMPEIYQYLNGCQAANLNDWCKCTVNSQSISILLVASFICFNLTAKGYSTNISLPFTVYLIITANAHASSVHICICEGNHLNIYSRCVGEANQC